MILDALYLFLDLFTLSFPLAQSWDGRLSYYKKWHALFPAIAVVGLFYIVWDICFTQAGIWGFNPRYLIGVDIINLPLEEWLFFLVVPFACVFIYEATIHYMGQRPLKKIARPLFIAVGITLLITGILNTDKAYTSLTFILTGLFLILHVFLIRRDYRDRFIFGYLFSLIPFFLVNGVLTGTLIKDQIVWYDNSENLGLKMGTIPVEDAIYLLLYLLAIVTIYEAILKRFPLLGIDNNKVT